MKGMQYFKYYKQMDDNNIDLAFKGPFPHQILLSLADALMESLTREDETDKIAKRVFSIFVELTQNIRDYSAEKKLFNQKEVGTGLIALQEHDAYFIILSANKVHNKDVRRISDYIDHINSLDKLDLKKLYKEKLSSKKQQENNGGVGFISIIRKSGNKLEMNMEKIDEDFTFFVISTRIDKEEVNNG